MNLLNRLKDFFTKLKSLLSRIAKWTIASLNLLLTKIERLKNLIRRLLN